MSKRSRRIRALGTIGIQGQPAPPKTCRPAGTTEPLPEDQYQRYVRVRPRTPKPPSRPVAAQEPARPAGFVAYQSRDERLLAMGFDCYRDYLRSPLWQQIRVRFLARTRRCYACLRPATQVHHTRYGRRDLDGSDTSGLRAVCESCHRKAEFREADGKKLDLDQANGKLDDMARWRKAGPVDDHRPPMSSCRRRKKKRKSGSATGKKKAAGWANLPVKFKKASGDYTNHSKQQRSQDNGKLPMYQPKD